MNRISPFLRLLVCLAIVLLAALPAASDGQAEDPDQPPGIDCLSGWCSSNSQCQTWCRDPYAICIKGPGATCGQCECAS